MTLFLEISVGAGRYLIDARNVVEIGAALPATDDERRATVDLRDLFEVEVEAGGRTCCVLYAQTSGEIAALLVDAAVGTVDLDDAEFRRLPPIGPLGELIDAVSTRIANRRPMLRLRAESLLAFATSLLLQPG